MKFIGERFVLWIWQIGQHVHANKSVAITHPNPGTSSHFNAGHEANTKASSSFCALGPAGCGVVVSQSQNVHSGRCRLLKDLGWRLFAVGTGGVRVQVDD